MSVTLRPLHVGDKLLGARAIATVPGRGYAFTLLAGETSALTGQEPPREAARAPQAKGNLPVQMAPLFGRDEEVAALGQLIAHHSVVSIVGPAGMPQPLVERLHAEIGRIMALPEVRKLVLAQGAEAATSTPAEFLDYIKRETALYTRIIKEAGIKIE